MLLLNKLKILHSLNNMNDTIKANKKYHGNKLINKNDWSKYA